MKNAAIYARYSSHSQTCDHDHRKILAAMPQLRESDRMIDLHHPVKAMDFSPEQYVIMEFAYDRMHSVVIPSYWDCEIRRALFHADVLFDPDSIESFGSKAYSAHLDGRTNLTGISLGRRYDTDELRHLINEHAVNFHAVSVVETERPQRVNSVTYRFRLPRETDEKLLRSSIQSKLSEQNWYYGERTRFTVPPDLRPSIRNLDVRDGHLLITMGPSFSDPRLIFRYIMDIPHGELIHQMPERAGFTLENRGVIDLAMTREMRDARIRGLENSTDISPVNEAETVYLSGNLCYKDLESIIARNYSIFSEDNNRSVNMGYLLGLIDFTASVSEIPEAEDPAMQDLKKFLSS